MRQGAAANKQQQQQQPQQRPCAVRVRGAARPLRPLWDMAAAVVAAAGAVAVGSLLRAGQRFAAGSDSAPASIRWSLAGVAAVAVIGAVTLPPNPRSPAGAGLRLLWRTSLVVAVTYMAAVLLLLLTQTRDSATALLHRIDTDVGVPVGEQSYAEDCSLFGPGAASSISGALGTVASQVDRFVLAHVLGWAFKAVLYRDAYLLHFLSVLFELAELSLSHHLPNFRECWWDRWVLDVLVCNTVGIHLGLAAMAWAQRSGRATAPWSWEPLRDPRAWLVWFAVSAVTMLLELNAFYLKSALLVPVDHPWNIYRLLLVGLCALPALPEFYALSHGRGVLGPSSWLLLALAALEAATCFKFSYTELGPRSTPQGVRTGGLIAAGAWLLATAAVYYRWAWRERGRRL